MRHSRGAFVILSSVLMKRAPAKHDAGYKDSLAQLRVNPDWARLPLFDRSGWTTVRFGDVVENVNETCDPLEAAVERFVGLEHLEPGSLHLRTWGTVRGGTTFTRRCRPGQVLFGKRRAYQRKVARAEFDAVVSGDIYVLQPKGGRLLAELLPFICLSERFFEHAVRTSAGSLSPRTNWRQLALFELDLPPLDMQHRWAEALAGLDALTSATKHSLKRHDEYLRAFASTATMSGLTETKRTKYPLGELPAHWGCIRLKEAIAECGYGPRFSATLYADDGNVRTVRTTDFDRRGGIDFESVPWAQIPDKTIQAHILRPGDFLLSRSGEYAGLTAVFPTPPDASAYIASAFLIRYRFTHIFLAAYMGELCTSGFGDQFVVPLATGSAQPNIAGSAFEQLWIPLPPVDEQRAIVAAIQRHRAVRHRVEDSLACIADMAKEMASVLV